MALSSCLMVVAWSGPPVRWLMQLGSQLQVLLDDPPVELRQVGDLGVVPLEPVD